MPKVTLTYPWTDKAGVKHRSGTTLDVADHIARDLVFKGRARRPSPASTGAAKKGAQAPVDKKKEA